MVDKGLVHQMCNTFVAPSLCSSDEENVPRRSGKQDDSEGVMDETKGWIKGQR
jgi:hypothetical protein